MDVSAPITAVVSTLDAHVLTVLAGTTEALTGEDVHRLAGRGSPNGVRAVLGRLTQQGIVDARPAGRATLYVANRDHLAWPAVEELTRLRQRLISNLRETIRERRLEPLNASLFGSTARGDGDADSDIDVLLISRYAPATSEDAEDWDTKVAELRADITRWTGNQRQIYELTHDEFKNHVRAGEPIVDAWRTEAIDLAGVSIRKMISTTRAMP